MTKRDNKKIAQKRRRLAAMMNSYIFLDEWRWKGCKKWRDELRDALDDYYADLQRKNELAKRHKTDDKLNVLKKANKGHSC